MLDLTVYLIALNDRFRLLKRYLLFDDFLPSASLLDHILIQGKGADGF